MNKNICLLVALMMCLTVTCTSNGHDVEFNNASYGQNFITLSYVTGTMFWCLIGSFTSLFWADGGAYFRRCFSNFVSKPVFY